MAWTLSPLPPGPLRHRLLHLTQARRLPLTEILVWHTQQQVTNAMVVGLTNRTRRLILSDGLLARCTASEIEALTEHEFAHVAGQHAWIRLIWWSLPVLYLTVFDQPPVDPVEVHGSAAIAPLLCLSFLACLWFVGFSGLCHRLEFHADRIAVRRLCQRQDPDRALKGYQSTLRKLTAASPRSTWTHPSYWERSWRLRDHSDRHTS
jgi:Zn-dependent protease with chaperone function